MCVRIFLVALLGIFSMFTVSAQSGSGITVKGNIIDKQGEPIIGASIIVTGTTSGTITDVEGNYTINASPNGSLEIKYLGYKTQIIPIQNRTTINITLEEDSELLSEVVVIGYGTVKKEDLTGSVSVIDATTINKGLATSASDLLVGKAPGLSVITDGGAPGSGAKILVRGGASMSASNDPLIIIDGVPIDNSGTVAGMANPLSTVNPNDIESFSVLKDASATAIYGSRASNGVIIITTKKGKSGGKKINISYDGIFSVSNKTGTIDVMDANEFRNFVTDKWGEGSQQANALGKTSTNWQDKIFRTAFSTDHNLSAMGVAYDVPYRVSVGYTNENGILKTSMMERWTGSIGVNPKFFDNHLSVNINVKGMYSFNRFGDKGAIGAAAEFDPTQPVYADPASKYGNGYYMSLYPAGDPIKIGIANPLAVLEQKRDVSDVNRSIGNIQLDYKMHFLPELRANLNLGYDVTKSNGTVTIFDNSPMSWTWGKYKNGWGENSTYDNLYRNQLLDFYLNYNNTFAEKHNLDVMGGYSYQKFYQKVINKYPYSRDMQEETGNQFYQAADDAIKDNVLISFFGRLNYSYDSRYLLTATFRRDGTSRFHKDNRWSNFPSVALAWRTSEETFMKQQNVLTDLKLRVGYGITGQQNVGDDFYPYMARYSYSEAGANYFFGDEQIALIRPDAYNPDLKWEETTTWNAGIDYGFLNNRITGTLDIYLRKTRDLLTREVPLPAQSMFLNQFIANIGKMENKGIEFAINAHPIVSKDWNWSVNYNVSYNKNEITKLTTNDDPNYKGVVHGGITGGTGNQILVHQVGKPRSSFYVLEQIYDADGNPIENAYVDQNRDGKIDEDDRIAYKSAAPKVYMGFSSQLSYKNWDMNFALHANIGNYAYNNIQSNREAYGTTFDPAGFLKNRYYTAARTNFNDPQFFSSHYVQNASFLRMDNISLGYTISNPLKFVESVRIYGTVQNVFVISKYKGLDPEFNEDGIDNNIYPRPRIFLLGVNLKF